MALRIYNTLTGGKEDFVPLEPGKVKMYVCGVTVYDNCHIGHARAYTAFDMIFRYLKYSGYDVTYIRNYTDIDDKIINRANEQGILWSEVAERFIGEFNKDMTALGIQAPTFEPKATEHIPEIIAIVQRLVDKGNAYEANGDVYFRVERFPGYLKLSKRNLEDMQAGARVDVDDRKENPMDFALWKSSKPGEPAWESPWGPGRPGWHIECSAMSMKFLGETFDIHGGGKDLVFPHHENEIAQSEAANGKQFVRYWMHNGFVNINSEKMSKSLGNFFTIKEVLDKYDPEVLRFFLLSAHYRSPIDFCDHNLDDAEAGLERVYKGLAAISAALDVMTAVSVSGGEAESDLVEKLAAFSDRFREAMDDDFNTALALAHVFELVRAANRLITEVSSLDEGQKGLLAAVREKITEVGQVLGLFYSAPVEYLERIKGRKVAGMSIAPEEIERLLAERAAARKAKDFKRSDEIRDSLLSQGIELLDGPQGTVWKVK
ncbi:cysteine--tRNA ligase [Geobacter pelophilus]|uniref:Cysteine--tRNA ligase n=1 Tax=Geoanaerobacter pelophilus TaxID=60036 RepID=A0AAW4LB20_9BACT|nr:cysteine--tRNA ligase [Geoanaerobacter pelophilus]MBT0665214.1 cysteine--tRNA ligase [Geoanaerobacter pelophilus]